MACEIPRPLIECILLGTDDDRQALQDSSILCDVWIGFAGVPDERLDLLITPYKEHAAGKVAEELADRDNPDAPMFNVAFLQGLVAASLTFEELLRLVVPMTSWWSDRRISEAVTAQNSLVFDVPAVELKLKISPSPRIAVLTHDRPHFGLGLGLPDEPTRYMPVTGYHDAPDYRVVAKTRLGGLHHDSRLERRAA